MDIVSRAPLRISFCGGGTDLPEYFTKPDKWGIVLSTTIDKYVTVRLESRDDNNIFIEDKGLGIIETFTSENDLGEEFKIVDAVRRYLNYEKGFNLVIESDAPAGSGLGGSSAFTVALLNAFTTLIREESYPKDYLAKMAVIVERDRMGVNGGWQDQYASAYGGLNMIQFRDPHVMPMTIHLARPSVSILRSNLLLCYTGRTRQSGDVHAEQKKNYDNPETIASLDKLVDATFNIFKAVVHEDMPGFGKLLHESWLEKKKLARGITLPFIDELYNAAMNQGAMGGKLLGAGGGGYLLFVCDTSQREFVKVALENLGGQVVDFNFDYDGAKIMEVGEKCESILP